MVDRRLLGGLWALASEPELPLNRHPFESGTEITEWTAAVLGASKCTVLRSGSRPDASIVPDLLSGPGPETLRTAEHDGRVALRMQLDSNRHRLVAVFLGPEDGAAFDLSLVDLVLQRLRAIGQQADYREKLAVSALVDPLTGLGNRAIADEAISSLTVGDALLVIDMDGLKALNDHYGHAAGDQTLRDLGNVLNRDLRAADTAARYGGDEIIVTMRAGTDFDTVGHRLLESWSRRRGTVTLSGGLAVCQPGETGRSTFERADQALYVAKQQGGNKVVTSA